MASSKNNKDDMIPDDSKSLAISQIIHKTHIELDEKGTKAAAATVLVVTAACDSVDSAPPEPKEVILDRPFAFAIVDNNTGLPVFMGIINTME
jgi:serpin B